MTVPAPVRLKANPNRITDLLRTAGFTFDAVKARLATDYRMWPPVGTGGLGAFRAFIQRAYMSADIGARMLTPDRSRLLGGAAAYFVRSGPRSPLDSLIWLFLLNEPVDLALLSRVFSQHDLDALVSMNLIRLDGTAAVCDLALFECGGLFLATDARVKPPQGVNAVMPLHPDSFDFAGSVSRRPVGAALDLCTGSGVHALLAARHSRHVVATDINPRALQFAEFNAWLNGVENVELRQGDLFYAVSSMDFDLILANPPYIPDAATTPGDNRYSGGPSGDVLWSRILMGLENHLRPGGLCQMIHLMVQFGAEKPEERIRTLLGPGVDHFDIIVLSNPVAFRNAETTTARSVYYGVTTVRRLEKPGRTLTMLAPSDLPLQFDISHLIDGLASHAGNWEHFPRDKRPSHTSVKRRPLTAFGLLPIRVASLALFCALVLREIGRRLTGR